MPAPRLLDKKAIHAGIATEQNRAIEQGRLIAKKVDAVRATLAEEEARLEQFRCETIATVQAEIDAKIKERDELVREIESLKAQLPDK